MRIIDADAYRDEFMNGVYDELADDPDNYRANRIITLFDNAPTIDAVPVRHGEWIFNGRFAELNHYACSNCNRTEFRMSDYCPNCGAVMDRKENADADS